MFEFTIVHGTLGDEEPTIQVTEGDILEFRWSSDEELNLPNVLLYLEVLPK